MGAHIGSISHSVEAFLHIFFPTSPCFPFNSLLFSFLHPFFPFLFFFFLHFFSPPFPFFLPSFTSFFLPPYFSPSFSLFSFFFPFFLPPFSFSQPFLFLFLLFFFPLQFLPSFFSPLHFFPLPYFLLSPSLFSSFKYLIKMAYSVSLGHTSSWFTHMWTCIYVGIFECVDTLPPKHQTK